MKKLLLLGMAFLCLLNSSLITAAWMIPSEEDEDFFYIDSDTDSDTDSKLQKSQEFEPGFWDYMEEEEFEQEPALQFEE